MTLKSECICVRMRTKFSSFVLVCAVAMLPDPNNNTTKREIKLKNNINKQLIVKQRVNVKWLRVVEEKRRT